MTIDERLDRLTERHEALTQTVELLAADVRQLTADVKQLTADATQQRRIMDDLMVGFSTLAELARSHNNRITRLEGLA